jgi:hypothetical protein
MPAAVLIYRVSSPGEVPQYQASALRLAFLSTVTAAIVLFRGNDNGIGDLPAM